jgi:chitosanase
MVLAISSVFENSSPELNFGSCSDIGDGNGYSAGFIQFTTLSGSALLVVQDYVSRNPTSELRHYIDQLKAVVGSGTLVPGFCDAWKRAAESDPQGFGDAQKDIQANEYLAPNENYVREWGLTQALSVGQLFDCSVQLGLSDCVNIAQGIKTPKDGGDEKQWLYMFIQNRDARLYQRGGAYASTLYRTRSYKWMVDNGYMGLGGTSAVMLENGGSQITINC